MKKTTPQEITVTQAIALLKTMDPDAVLVTESDWGAAPVTQLTPGVLYRYAKTSTGTTGFLFSPQPVKARQQRAAVSIG